LNADFFDGRFLSAADLTAEFIGSETALITVQAGAAGAGSLLARAAAMSPLGRDQRLPTLLFTWSDNLHAFRAVQYGETDLQFVRQLAGRVGFDTATARPERRRLRQSGVFGGTARRRLSSRSIGARQCH
jgi:hypothetical protein